jgi:flavin reductase (DIM6/NTAB) family NADH-FMN oxidoreductase RutF
MISPKQAIPLDRANRLINNGCTVLVSCQYHGPPNIITIAWQTPVSHNPPILAIAVGKTRYSHNLILEAGEFVVNVPNATQLEIIELCGSTSGREHNKFEMAKLTAIPAHIVSVPLIGECMAHLECKLHNRIEVGDHTVFFGEVVAASVGEGLFDEFWKLESDHGRTVHHLGGKCYAVACQRITYNDKQK